MVSRERVEAEIEMAKEGGGHILGDNVDYIMGYYDGTEATFTTLTWRCMSRGDLTEEEKATMMKVIDRCAKEMGMVSDEE